VVLVPWVCTPSSLEVHALDVGHGTAAVIRSPGGAVWIFDAGSRDRPDVDREALAPLLRACDATRIGIVLSHPDRDHDGAMGWLVERYPPALWAGALPAQVDARLPHTVLRADIGQGRMKLPSLDSEGTSEGTSGGSSGGDSGCGTLGLELSRGLDVAGNEGSRCLEITWRDDRIVLSGDAEAEGLAAWLAGRPRRGPVRMLLFPHHGSDTNLVGPLLAALRPTEIWISASGTPGIERELERREIRCRITSVEGPLELTLP
jgi:competence protein ComEC